MEIVQKIHYSTWYVMYINTNINIYYSINLVVLASRIRGLVLRNISAHKQFVFLGGVQIGAKISYERTYFLSVFIIIIMNNYV